MARKHLKPTGLLGPVVIHGDGRPARFRPISFPSDKAQREQMIVSATVSPDSDLGRFYGIRTSPVRNPEDDFDFSLETPRGGEQLELMEVAPLERSRGSYASAPLSYTQGELADAIIDSVGRKSRRYGERRAAGINLLLYSTDFRFLVDNDVVWLVAKWASATPHAFKSIVYVAFLDEESIEGKVVYPQPGRDFSRVDETKVRGRRVLIADITSPQISADGRSVRLPLGRKGQ